MLKKVTIIFSAIILTLITAGCSANKTAISEELNILTWDGYIPKSILDGFSESENIKINISNFESNEEMLAKISADNSAYDLVIGSDYIIDIARKENLLYELDKSKIPNYENLDEGYLSKFYDPENKYTVPYSAGSPVIVYDKAKIGIEINGYKDLWNSALKGKLLLIDDARNIVGITLKSIGESMNTTDKNKLSQAKDELMKLKQNIHHLNYTNPHESLINGDVDVAYLFSSQAYLALEARPELEVVFADEGIGFGIDSWFIPKGAKNADNAHKFLNYITDAENGAKITEQIMYLSPNKAAREFLPESIKNNPIFNIPSEKLQNSEFIQDIGDAAEEYTKIWTEFKQ